MSPFVGTKQVLDLMLATELSVDLPESDERSKLLSLIKQRFEEAHDRPPVDQLEAVLRARFTPERARALLFQPSVDEFGAFYPLLIRDPPAGAPRNHPQRLLQVLFLGAFYLLHQKQPELLAEFLTSGGMVELVPLLVTENPYIRGHAVELLHTMTSSEHFDWFNTGKINRVWHRCLLQLVRTPLTLNLLENRACPIPGGSLLCLQILAFWLSWVRFFYCKEKVLRVDANVLEGLRLWSTKSTEDGVSEEEVELANKLHDDFSRFPVGPNSSNAGSALLLENPTSDYNSALPADPRELGNCEYQNGNYSEAIRMYSQVLALSEQDSPNLAKLYCNRAAAQLELGKATGCDEKLWLAVKDCELALEHNNVCPKATYRMYKAYEKLNHVEQARKPIERLLENEGGSTEEKRMLLKVHKKLFRDHEQFAGRQEERDEIIQAVLKRIGAGEIPPNGTTLTVKASTSRPAKRTEDTGHLNTDMQNAVVRSCEPENPKDSCEPEKPVTCVGAESKQTVSYRNFEAPGEELEEAHIVETIQAIDAILPRQHKQALDMLESLSKAKRFRIIIMFLDMDMQKRLAGIFQILAGLLAAESEPLRRRLASLRESYRVPS